MKAAIFGYKSQDEKANEINNIIKVLEKYNVRVDSDYFKTDVKTDRNDPEGVYKRITQSLHKADVIIFEATVYSLGIGMILGRAVEMKKPILILHNTDSEYKVSMLALSHSEREKRIILKQYNHSSLESQVSDFISEASGMLDQKFLFSFSPDIAKYLQWSSEKYNIPMVEILRELLNERMSKDEEWNKYINS